MKVLCTQPIDAALSSLPARGMDDYIMTLEAMLRRATSSVDIVCPFVDDDGVAIIQGARQRGLPSVVWRLFVRRSTPALATFAALAGCHVYEYVKTDATATGRGFHCKIFIVDGREAIVGSANLIYANLVENVEIGLHITDPHVVQQLLEVPRALRKASRTVR